MSASLAALLMIVVAGLAFWGADTLLLQNGASVKVAETVAFAAFWFSIPLSYAVLHTLECDS